MTRLQDKAQGLTKQFVGEMIGDEALAEEGRRQEQDARKAQEQAARQDEGVRDRPDDQRGRKHPGADKPG